MSFSASPGPTIVGGLSDVRYSTEGNFVQQTWKQEAWRIDLALIWQIMISLVDYGEAWSGYFGYVGKFEVQQEVYSKEAGQKGGFAK